MGCWDELIEQDTEWQRLFFLFIEVSHLHHRAVHRAVRGLGIHRGQPPLLHELWKKDGMTQSEIGEQLHVQPSTVSNMVSRMAEAGFVERRDDPVDHRVSRVYLTEKGSCVRERLLAAERELTYRMIEGLGDEEQETLTQLLMRIRQNLRELHAKRE